MIRASGVRNALSTERRCDVFVWNRSSKPFAEHRCKPRCSIRMPSGGLRTLRTHVRLQANANAQADRRRGPADRLRHARRVRARRARWENFAELWRPPAPHRPGADPLKAPSRSRPYSSPLNTVLRPWSHSEKVLRNPRSGWASSERIRSEIGCAGRQRRVAAQCKLVTVRPSAAHKYAQPATKTIAGCTKKNRQRPTLPGGCPPSTIGAERLNCSVRNGKRCLPFAMRHRNFARRPPQ